MVIECVTDLKDRNGATLPGIKSKMAEKYKIDPKAMNHHIKKAIKSHVDAGQLINVGEIGFKGRWHLSPAMKAMNSKAKTLKSAPKVAKVNSSTKKTASMSTAAPKKSVTPKKMKTQSAAPAKKKKVAEKENVGGTAQKKAPAKKTPKTAKLVPSGQVSSKKAVKKKLNEESGE